MEEHEGGQGREQKKIRPPSFLRKTWRRPWGSVCTPEEECPGLATPCGQTGSWASLPQKEKS